MALDDIVDRQCDLTTWTCKKRKLKTVPSSECSDEGHSDAQVSIFNVDDCVKDKNN